jgi:phage terminase large subunit-like protein
MMPPDPIAWINSVLRNPETGRPFELLPAEIAFLQHAFRLDEDGRAVYPELVYSAPKKSGKTAFAAIVTLVVTLLYGGHDPEAICAANDLEQASSRVFSAIKKIVRASPALRDRAFKRRSRSRQAQ